MSGERIKFAGEKNQSSLHGQRQFIRLGQDQGSSHQGHRQQGRQVASPMKSFKVKYADTSQTKERHITAKSAAHAPRNGQQKNQPSPWARHIQNTANAKARQQVSVNSACHYGSSTKANDAWIECLKVLELICRISRGKDIKEKVKLAPGEDGKVGNGIGQPGKKKAAHIKSGPRRRNPSAGQSEITRNTHQQVGISAPAIL